MLLIVVLNRRLNREAEMKLLVLAGAALICTGCTQSVDEMSYAQLQKYAAQMVEKCQKQGVPDTELNACAEQEMRADQSRRMRQRQVGAAISAAGQGMQRNAAMTRTVNCTSTPSSTWVGGPVSSVRTTCY